MHSCYVGESFEQSFKMYDARDRTKAVDGATFQVYLGDDLVQSGALAIAEDGHTGSFRFNASQEGVHRIVVSWQIGTDAWKQPFLVDVVRP